MKVRIKTWEELLATPGVIDSNGGYLYIPDNNSFPDEMMRLCNKVIDFEFPRVSIIDEEGLSWTIEDWMVTEIKSHNFKLIYDILNNEE
jgi:hypothetical protein